MMIAVPTETALLGGGCFWCLEAVFNRVEGVIEVEPGYAGGPVPNPTYEQVCGGRTGHAEALRISFDTSIIGFADLLEVFFALHDPTTENRQGNDVGSQYRSVIFCRDVAQAATARNVIAQLTDAQRFAAPIVTEVEGDVTFWPAEPCHSNYYDHNPMQPYCMAVVAPKIDKLRRLFATRVKTRLC
ncbi:peptide-methionine (S)-S-oxide reductase MsrA [Methyloversatilis sp.]|uniref:peptide-methionine (S)-S-oxide reductase MsrA n=1 Tax=Methyloversatilis sp. TaxID=2569862 RepID=UPI003014C325